jgi:hypothetical protein
VSIAPYEVTPGGPPVSIAVTVHRLETRAISHEVQERRAFAAEACAALDAQIHVHEMGRRAEQLLGPAVSQPQH